MYITTGNLFRAAALLAAVALLQSSRPTLRAETAPQGKQGNVNSSPLNMPPISADPHESDTMKSIEEKQAALRNSERQKRLVSDTDKLLALATQLHDDVGKTNKNILSLDVVKRAAEIEKLAHDVKERMKTS